jgi:hypothetical protein
MTKSGGGRTRKSKLSEEQNSRLKVTTEFGGGQLMLGGVLAVLKLNVVVSK